MGKDLFEVIFGKPNKNLVGDRDDFRRQLSKKVDGSIFGSVKQSDLNKIFRISQLEEIFPK